MAWVHFIDNYTEWGSRKLMASLAHDWFDTEGYTKVDIPWHAFEGCDRSYKEPSPKLYSRSELRRWLQSNCEGDIIIGMYERSSSIQTSMYFELESDAYLYKLTWG